MEILKVIGHLEDEKRLLEKQQKLRENWSQRDEKKPILIFPEGAVVR